MNKNTLIYIGLGAIAAAVVTYFFVERKKGSSDDEDFFSDAGGSYVSDSDIAAYDMNENTGPAVPVQ